MAGFIFKVMGLSAVIAIAIKLSATQVTLEANSTLALMAVWLPSLVLLLILGWRWRSSHQIHSQVRSDIGSSER